MAMRPRGGSGAGNPRRGARSGVVRPVYEDFKPMSEWQQVDESHILNVYLPGFTKEQINVSTEGRNTIRVQGERLVAGNKWNRFQEEFQIPENGVMNSIRAKYQGGILTITVPKVRVDALPQKAQAIDDIQKQQPTPPKDKEKVIAEASSGQATESQKPSRDIGDQKRVPTPQTGHDKAFPAVGTNQSTDKKSLEPGNTSGDPEKEHERDGDQRARSSTPFRGGTVVPNDTHIALERQNDVSKTAEHKEGKKTIDSKELPDAETAKKTKLVKDGAKVIPKKNAHNKELHQKVVKGLTGLNEERQLLMNMGVAMLVIVALTSYITYSFASAKDKN